MLAKHPTLDEQFAAIAALESHAAKLRVGIRLNTPLAGVHNSTPPKSSTTPMQRIAAAGGAAAMNLKSEIARLETELTNHAPGTTSHRALSSKIQWQREQLSKHAAKR